MSTIASLVAEIGLDLGPLKKGMAEAKGEATSGGGIFSGLGDTLGKVGGIAAAGAAAGIAALGVGLKACIDQANEAALANAQLNAVIKSTHGVAGVTSQAAQDLASSMSRVTMFDDQATEGAEAMLLTFTSIHKDVFPAATKTALDMSQALGQGLKESSIQLGKALNDPIHGITALQRVGVTFTQQQKDQIAAMVQAGNVAGAQKVILAELNREFGGSAEAAGKTLPGKLAIMGHAFDQAKESIGNLFIPILTRLLTAVQPLLSALGDWLPKAVATVSGILNGNGSPAFANLGHIFQTQVLPLLQQLGQHLQAELIPALMHLATFVQANVLPALLAFAGFILANVVPVLLKLADFVVKNVIPVIAQLVAWFVKNVVPILRTLWQVISDDVLPALESIWKNISQNLIPAIQNLWNKISPLLLPVLHAVGDVLKNVVGPALNIVIGIVSHLIDVITTIISKIGDFLGLLGQVKDAVGGALGHVGDFAHNLHIPGFATGGVTPYTGVFDVGENGKERVILPQGTTIIPHDKLAAASAGNSSGGNTYHNYFYGTSTTAQDVVAELEWQRVIHG